MHPYVVRIKPLDQHNKRQDRITTQGIARGVGSTSRARKLLKLAYSDEIPSDIIARSMKYLCPAAGECDECFFFSWFSKPVTYLCSRLCGVPRALEPLLNSRV